MDSGAPIDISGIKINSKKTVSSRYEEYISKVKNPYSYSVDTVKVTIGFKGENTLTDALCNVAKYKK